MLMLQWPLPEVSLDNDHVSEKGSAENPSGPRIEPVGCFTSGTKKQLLPQTIDDRHPDLHYLTAVGATR